MCTSHARVPWGSVVSAGCSRTRRSPTWGAISSPSTSRESSTTLATSALKSATQRRPLEITHKVVANKCQRQTNMTSEIKLHPASIAYLFCCPLGICLSSQLKLKFSSSPIWRAARVYPSEHWSREHLPLVWKGVHEASRRAISHWVCSWQALQCHLHLRNM